MEFDRKDPACIPEAHALSAWICHPLWQPFNASMAEVYHAAPIYAFSRCSWEYGWNIKYKYQGNNLCTIYPYKGYFRVLLVIAQREKLRFEQAMDTFCADIRQLYLETKESNGRRWLIVDVEDEDQRFQDVKRIIALRA